MAGAQAPLGARARRLLPELAHGPDGAGGHLAEVLPGLDPPVLDFGLGGLSAEEDDAGRMRIDPGRHLRDMGHEHVIAGNVVVRGEDGDRRVGIPPGDLGGRREDGRGRPAVRGLSEDVRMRGAGELRRNVLGVPLHRDDDRPLDGEADPDPVEGLAEQRAASEDRHVLLRALIAEGGADEGPQAHALSSGEHDGPEVRPRASRRRGALRREGALLSGDRRRLAHGRLSDLACGGHGTCRPRRAGTQLGCQAPAGR